jgi:hypothetical protein
MQKNWSNEIVVNSVEEHRSLQRVITRKTRRHSGLVLRRLHCYTKIPLEGF